MAGFEYKTNINSVVNALKDYNTCTSTPFLSQSLTTEINNNNIFNRNPEVYELNGRNLPAIFVRIPNSEEDFEGIGPTGSTGAKKRKTVIYDIIGMYPKPSMAKDEDDSLEEIYKLSRNIEAVFQAEYKLSNTALWCNPRSTDFQGPFGLEDGTVLKTVMIELEAQYLFR